jgi:adenosine kinase
VKKRYEHVILTGSISIDRIMNFGGKYSDLIQPDKLHVLSLSILINKLTNSRGGVATNIAYNLALLKEKPVVLGSIGEDAKGYIDDLSEMGIDTSYVHVSDLPTATFTVLTDSVDNQVGGFYPGAMSDISKLSLKPWYGQNALVVISAGDPTGMDQLVKECIENKIDYIYDLGQQVTNITVEQMRLGLSKAQILFGNDYELGTILNRTGYSEVELNSMIPIIVTTLGAEGTRITGSSVKNQIMVPALKDVTPVDPTGAGDSYRAGFLYGYLRNWELGQCAQLGSTIATYTIEKHGTQTHTFTHDELIKKHEHAYGMELPK